MKRWRSYAGGRQLPIPERTIMRQRPQRASAGARDSAGSQQLLEIAD